MAHAFRGSEFAVFARDGNPSLYHPKKVCLDRRFGPPVKDRYLVNDTSSAISAIRWSSTTAHNAQGEVR